MQKRHKQGSKVGTELPLTVGDVGAPTRSRDRLRRRKRKVAKDFDPFAEARFIGRCLAVGLLLICFIIFFFWPQLGTSVKKGKNAWIIPADLTNNNDNVLEKLPLSNFHSLDYALANADIVALYFAASWCPMSTGPTKLIREMFPLHHGSVLPPESENFMGDDSRKKLAIVYVSSDETEEQLLDYTEQSSLIAIPYDSKDRNDLKVHFRTCAKREMEELGLETRRHEIPTIIVIDSLTHGILTTQGITEFQPRGTATEGVPTADKILTKWEQMQSTVRQLELTTK